LRLNSRRYLRPRRRSTTLRLQTTSESFLRRLLHQLPLPLGSRTFRPPRCLDFRDRQFFDGLILLLLLLIFRPDLPRTRRRNRWSSDGRRGCALFFFFFFFFFFSAAFTAEIAVATNEADFFATVDLVLRRDFATPAAGSAPASASVSSSASTM
jgi:hypothetical protein